MKMRSRLIGQPPFKTNWRKRDEDEKNTTPSFIKIKKTVGTKRHIPHKTTFELSKICLKEYLMVIKEEKDNL